LGLLLSPQAREPAHTAPAITPRATHRSAVCQALPELTEAPPPPPGPRGGLWRGATATAAL
jgi:hypothetical protein